MGGLERKWCGHIGQPEEGDEGAERGSEKRGAW